MKSKSHKEFIKPTAEELRCSETLVENAVEFFYGNLQKMIGSLDHPQIEVLGLGTFKVRPPKLNELIETQKNHLNKLGTPSTMTKMSIKRDVEVKLEKCKNLKEKIDQERERRKQFRKDKYGK